MREFGISLELKPGQELFVYYRPMSYLDWARYTDNNGITDPDPSVIRYIFSRYITRAFIRVVGNNGELDVHDIDIASIADMGPAISVSIATQMSEKSGFNSDDQFGETIKALELKSRTLLGSYDYFLFVHLGFDGYLRSIEMDSSTRAQLIMMVQKATGIDVLKRFKDSIDFSIPLDIMTDPVKYEAKIKNDARHGRIQASSGRTSSLPEGSIPVADPGGATTSDLLEATRRSLAAELAIQEKNKAQKKPFFNWHEDQAFIDKFDRDQDRGMMEQPPQQKPHQFIPSLKRGMPR